MDENYNNDNIGSENNNSFDPLNSDYSYNSYDSSDSGSSTSDIAGSSYTSDILSSVSRDNDNLSSYNYGYDSMNGGYSNPNDMGGGNPNPNGMNGGFGNPNPNGMNGSFGNPNPNGMNGSFGNLNPNGMNGDYSNPNGMNGGYTSQPAGESVTGQTNQSDATAGGYSGPAYDPTHNGQYTYDPVSGTYVQNQSTGNNNYSGANNTQTGYTSSGTGTSGTYTYNYNASYDTAQKQESKTAGVISLVCGILSLVCCCFGCTGIIFGIPAIICGIVQVAKNKGNKGYGIAGIITGAIGLLLGIVMLIGYATGAFESNFDIITNDSVTDHENAYNYDYDYQYDDSDYNFDYDSFFNELESEFDFDNDDFIVDNDNISSNEMINRIYGKWRINSGTGNACYIFNEDGSWGWYKDYNDLNDNYYAGAEYEILSGSDAFDYYGMDDEEAQRLETDKDRFFCLKLYVDEYISGGVDKSEQYNGEDPLSVALYLDKNGNEAILVNMNSADQYNVEKIN